MKQKTMRALIVIAFLALFAPASLADQIVARLDPVSYNSMRGAIATAKAHLLAQPDDTYIIDLPAGLHHIVPPDGAFEAISLFNIMPGTSGRFVIRGAGMDATTLAMPDFPVAVHGRETYRVTISDIHFTRHGQGTTQGHVVSVEPGAVTLKVQPGFPSPLDYFDADRDQGIGRYLKRYAGSAAQPIVVQTNNWQVPWSSVEDLGGNTYRFSLLLPHFVAPYAVGHLIGVKQKHGGDAYRFVVGDDIRFERVKWTQRTRGIFIDVDHPAVINSVIERAPEINGQAPALASNGGGPQIMGRSKRIHGAEVVGNTFTGTGDDPIALFDADGVVAGNTVIDPFDRGILLVNSAKVVLSKNRLVRAEVVYLD